MTWDWVLAAVTVLSGAAYLGVGTYLYLGLNRAARLRPLPAACDGPGVAVIVAARDEEEAIGGCLRALASLDYPRERLEVVVVDDNSGDNTPQRVEEFAAKHGFIKYLRQEGPGRYRCPKKSALALGIEASRGEIIFVTDADCRPGPAWIKGMLAHFDPGTNLVCGYSPLVSGPGAIDSLLWLNSFLTPLIGAASAGWGNILTAVGRNMAYRRQAFDRVGGFDRIGHIVSGDDILLAREIQREFPGSARFAFEPETYVPSIIRAEDRRDFFRQGVRHNSRGPHLGRGVQAAGFGVILFYLAVLTGLLATAGGLGGLWGLGRLAAWVSLGAFVLKLALDRAVLSRAATLLRSRWLLRYQLPAEIIHLAAFPLFTILGTAAGFRWRGRTSRGGDE